MYTRPDFHVHLLFHLLHYTEKKLHCDCREKKYTYPARSSIHSPYFQQARRLFIFPSQLMAVCFISQPGQILPEERVFCRSGSVGSLLKTAVQQTTPLGTLPEKFFKTILLANNLPMYMYTYVVLPGGGGYSFRQVIQVCAAPKGMIFQPFWSEIGYQFFSRFFQKKLLHHQAIRPFLFQCLRQPCTCRNSLSRAD